MIVKNIDLKKYIYISLYDFLVDSFDMLVDLI